MFVHLKNIFFWFQRLIDQSSRVVLLISSPTANGNAVPRELSPIYFQQVFNQVKYLHRGQFDRKTLFWSLHQTTDSSKASKKRNWRPWFSLNILMFLRNYSSNLFHQSVSQNQYFFGKWSDRKTFFLGSEIWLHRSSNLCCWSCVFRRFKVSFHRLYKLYVFHQVLKCGHHFTWRGVCA